MNEFMINKRIEALSNSLDKENVEALRRQNQLLQDFVIWLKGYLDGNISKRGEGKP